MVVLLLAGRGPRLPRHGRTTPLRRCGQGRSGGAGGHIRGPRRTGTGEGAVTERPQVARTVGMASSRYQAQKALRAGTSVCSTGIQFRAPAAALAQL